MAAADQDEVMAETPAVENVDEDNFMPVDPDRITLVRHELELLIVKSNWSKVLEDWFC